MGFINNHSDNFLKSNSAWGDDNVTYYNVPKGREQSQGFDPRDMNYEDIEDMISQVSSVVPSNQQDAEVLQRKLNYLEEEKSKRDELEEVTRIERDDAFEPHNTLVKEDVVDKKPPIKVTERPSPKPIEPKPVKPIVTGLEDMLEESDMELEEILNDDITIPEVNATTGDDDTTNFLMAALIIIVAIKIMD